MSDIDPHAVSLTNRAIDTYRVYYPDGGGREVLGSIRDGVEVTMEEVRAVLGRSRVSQARGDARYVIHPERTGVAVLVPTDAGVPHARWHELCCVTFLRFGRGAHDAARRAWPTDAPLTAVATWAPWIVPTSPHESWIGGAITKIRGTPWVGGLPALDESVVAGRCRWVTDTDAVLDLADGSAVIVRVDGNRRIAQCRGFRQVSGGI